MTKKAVSLVVAGMWLLGAATAVSADGAWVLWKHERTIAKATGFPSLPERWAIENSFGNRSACLSAIDALESKMRQGVQVSGGALSRVNETVLENIIPGNTVQYVDHYRCLPDTVDPRGRKGGQ